MEDVNINQKLSEILELTEENNRILRGLRLDSRISRTWTIIKFLIIVLPLVYAYFYFLPHFGQIMKAYQDLVSQVETIQNVQSNISKDVNSVSKSFQGILPKSLDSLK